MPAPVYITKTYTSFRFRGPQLRSRKTAWPPQHSSCCSECQLSLNWVMQLLDWGDYLPRLYQRFGYLQRRLYALRYFPFHCAPWLRGCLLNRFLSFFFLSFFNSFNISVESQTKLVFNDWVNLTRCRAQLRLPWVYWFRLVDAHAFLSVVLLSLNRRSNFSSN